jgi:hypothetical protein
LFLIDTVQKIWSFAFPHTVYPHISGPLIRGESSQSDFLSGRRPEGLVKDSYPIRIGRLKVTCQLSDPPPSLYRGRLYVIVR